MLQKLQFMCLVASIGLVAADRIDLFAQRGPFILTPFLVFAPLTLLIFLLRGVWRGSIRLKLPPQVLRQRTFLVAAIAFVFLALLSIPFGLDPQRGLVSFLDLMLVVALGYSISVLILLESDIEKLILTSITIGLIADFAFCIGEYIAWSHGLVIVQGHQASSWVEWTFAPQPMGNWMPRLAGTTFDANRTGFVSTMYVVLLDNFTRKSRWASLLRYANGALVFITLSRSAILCWIIYYLLSKKLWQSLMLRKIRVWIAGLAIVGMLAGAVFQKQIEEAVVAWEISDLLVARMDMGSGTSGQSHVMLIKRGFDVWAKSAKTIMVGIGFNSGPKVLTDLLGEGKYINFHCLYVTVLAELGAPAFIVLMVILVCPIFLRKGALQCAGALIVFNISYQSHMEPMFWIIMAVLWSFERTAPSGIKFLALDHSSAVAGSQ